MAGKTSQKAVTTKLKLTPQVELDLFVVDVELYLEKQQLNLKKVWPTLNNDLRKRVEQNMAHGSIDIIIGLDQLYTKIHNGRCLSHPTKGISLLSTCLGWSAGGSLNPKLESLAVPHSIPPSKVVEMAMVTNESEATQKKTSCQKMKYGKE